MWINNQFPGGWKKWKTEILSVLLEISGFIQIALLRPLRDVEIEH